MMGGAVRHVDNLHFLKISTGWTCPIASVLGIVTCILLCPRPRRGTRYSTTDHATERVEIYVKPRTEIRTSWKF